MAQAFHQGDPVQWSAGQGKTTGVVQRRVTQATEVDGHTVAASEQEPRYLVKNDSTGRVTGHKPETLEPLSSDEQATAASDRPARAERRAQLQDKIQEFDAAVNMTAREIADWLDTEASQSVGQTDESGAIKGRKSGQHIIQILRKPQSDYTEADLQRIKKVVGYIHRHTAQRPSGDIENTPWRYSLMNWGHDPLKH